jgi:hypothetical protein
MDGVAITDMAALGSSPTYYDFDMFQEMQVTTGGADLTSATPGVGLNFVLKGGSNTPRGSARVYFENESMQSNNMPDDLAASIGGKNGKGNRMDKYTDWGGELGGPILKDRLWAWGAYGKTDVTVLTLASTPDQTILDNRSLKLTGQATQNIRANYTYFRGDKLKYGRSASTTRPPETTVDQSGPTALHKGEVNLVLGNNLFVTGRGSKVSGGFALTPQGGLDTNMYRDDGNVWHGSYTHYETIRPQWSAQAEGNYFMGRNEIKFGFGWRRADVDSTSIVPGNGIITYHTGYPTIEADVVAWEGVTSMQGVYSHAYVGDSISWDRLTLNFGLRWDRQTSSVNANSAPGNSLFPNLLPDITGVAAKDALVYNSIVPRIGATYALDESRQTLLRASYASFASQLNATAGSFLSVVQYRGVYLYDVADTNGNGYADAAEIAGRTCSEELANAGTCNWSGFDIDNPGNLDAPLHSVGDYKTPMTHEFQLGIDRELMPNFGVSGTFTYRHFNHFTWRNNGLVGTDYAQIGTVEGSDPAIGNYSAAIYGPTRIPSATERSTTVFRERDGYSRRYVGFEVAATKRLSNKWMARFGFSTNSHTEHFDSMAAMTDPTPTQGSPNIDGGTVVTSSGGSGKSGIYQVLPKYQFIATGLYQAPWGINLAANMLMRQGFAMPYYRGPVSTTDPLQRNKNILVVGAVDQEHLPTVTSLDARVGKEFQVNRLRFNVDIDLFNVMNSATILGREYNLQATTANTVREIMNPRILRVGVRFAF